MSADVPSGAGEANWDPVDRLIELLNIEPAGPDRYRVPNQDTGHGDRVFGGQVAAQAMRAAVDTIDVDHHAHSLHSYFLRPGKPGIPIEFEVERTRDGRSFTTRRVLASQGEEVIFEMSASFHAIEEGRDYQFPIATDVPDPEAAPERLIFIPDEARPFLPMEIRELGATEPNESGWHRSSRRAWIKIKRRLPDDPMLHVCLLTYLSDMGAVFGALAPTDDFSFERFMGASLDHAMWFHRPLRADEWFLYDLHAISNAGSRGVARGTMHSIDGTLGVSLVQEALLRMAPKK